MATNFGNYILKTEKLFQHSFPKYPTKYCIQPIKLSKFKKNNLPIIFSLVLALVGVGSPPLALGLLALDSATWARAKREGQ